MASGLDAPVSTILFTSLPADMGEGYAWASSTVTALYPRRLRCSAVEAPQVPPPITMMGEVWVKGSGMILWVGGLVCWGAFKWGL